MTEETTRVLTILCCHIQEDEELTHELALHLSVFRRLGSVQTISQRNISADEAWKNSVDQRVKEANIILLSVTPAFLASQYCSGNEFRAILERHKQGKAYAIPVLLHPSPWKNSPMGELKALPAENRAVSDWYEINEGFVEVAKGVGKAIKLYNLASESYSPQEGNSMAEQEEETQVVLFEGRKPIRRQWYQGQMYYSLVDIASALSETNDDRRYWSDLKRTILKKEGGLQMYEKIVHLKMRAPDGKMRTTDAGNRETAFRIIQSISSPQAEPFKLFLAESGEQRLQTIEHMHVDIEAERRRYRLQGYDEEWIEKRIQSILVRSELTSEWEQRGAEQKDYGVLTNDIATGTFDKTTHQHLTFKGLTKGSLRDHMTPMELILTMLGEQTATELHRERDSQGVLRLRKDAQNAGSVAGEARQLVERQLGTSVVSPESYLLQSKAQQQPSLFESESKQEGEQQSS